MLDYSKEGKYTVVGFCSGTIAGLVAATPCSGFVPAWGALIIGIASGAICNYATKREFHIHSLARKATENHVIFFSSAVKYYMRVDDSLDVFAEHAMGGVVGLIGNGIFAADYIISLDGVTTTVPGTSLAFPLMKEKLIKLGIGGWIQHNWKQLYKQVAYVAAVMAYSFVMTAIIAKGFDLVPFLRLRADEESEMIGMDDAEVRVFTSSLLGDN
jgi:Amt family ammonium transporter